MNKKKTTERKTKGSHKSLTFCTILGSCCAIGILFLLLALFSCISLAAKNPHKYLSPLSFFAIYTSTFFGGFIATKKNSGRDALLCGSLTGLTSALLLCLIFLALGALLGTQSTPLSWLFRALSIVSSVLGALLATKKRKVAKNIHKRRKR